MSDTDLQERQPAVAREYKVMMTEHHIQFAFAPPNSAHQPERICGSCHWRGGARTSSAPLNFMACHSNAVTLFDTLTEFNIRPDKLYDVRRVKD
jgi:hypothetical protein